MSRKLGSRVELQRRDLLRAMAATGAATFLPGLRTANAATAPKRLLLFYSGSGVPRHIYKISGAGGGPATETDFVFPDVRSPLNEIKKDLVVLENVDMVSATVDPTRASNAHFEGETHALAATGRANGDTAGGPSIDQYIAKAINSPNPVTRIPSLALAVQTDGNVSSNKVCTADRGQVVALNPNPASVYKRLFGDVMVPMGTTQTGPSAADLAAQNKSVVDVVLGDFEALKPKLGRAELTKLDAHAQAVRDLEKRLTLNQPVGGATPVMPSAGCQKPASTLLTGTGNSYPGTSAMYKANFDAMIRLVQAAFACDLTRVALVSVGEPKGDEWGYKSGSFGTSDAHDLIHKTSYNNAGTLKGNPDAMRTVVGLHQLECRQLVATLDVLRAVTDVDGRSMLDNTIVLWCSQIAEHGHALDYLPWMVAGGANAGFRPGRYLRYDRVNGKGAPHNNLFVSIAQAMGVQTNTFGDARVCTGPLARLRG